MRLAGYLRVSTRRQVREGWSLDEQQARIEEWAAPLGHDVVFFEDAAVSGAAPLDTRKGLLRALGCLYRGEVAGIVVARLDRLTRDLILQETLLLEIWRHGGIALSTVEVESEFLRRDDPGDPARRLIRQIMGAVIEYQKSTSRLYLEACRQRKAMAGGYVGGRPRYGWEAKDGELAQVEAEQAVIARMKEMRVLRKASLQAVADALNEDGVPGPEGNGWTRTAVRRVLRAEGLSTARLDVGRPKRPKKKRRPKRRQVVRRRKKPVDNRVRRRSDGKAIIPRPEWRGTTEDSPW